VWVASWTASTSLLLHLLGEIKPDERVFRRVMSELHVEPDRLLFFDDSRLNVAAAAGLGIRAFVVDGLDDTRRGPGRGRTAVTVAEGDRRREHSACWPED